MTNHKQMQEDQEEMMQALIKLHQQIEAVTQSVEKWSAVMKQAHKAGEKLRAKQHSQQQTDNNNNNNNTKSPPGHTTPTTQTRHSNITSSNV